MASVDEQQKVQIQPDELVNSVAKEDAALGVRRYFTIAGRDPFTEIEWETRDAFIPGKDKPVFEQKGVEFPKFWSQTATNIVAQKYFRGRMASPERERSVKQMIGRVATTIGTWGRTGGYFVSEDEAQTFEDELKAILVNQLAAFNSPVWFNVGFEERPQGSACFILSIEDSMESILDWIRREGIIFRGGSGSGVNLSRLRSSKEQLSKGGYASGPVSFMRGADASAGTIKSGGKTRRAAKMIVLDVDHPDIEEFIWCKAREEEKARVLEAAGYDMSLDSPDWASIQYQNANNSVRVSDAFMAAAESDADWNLTARTDGSVLETIKARKLLRDMAEAAWRCADPGVQYDTTINSWHTLPNTGRINASNPCCFVGETLVDTEEGFVRFDELFERKARGEALPRIWSFAVASTEPILGEIADVWIAGVASRIIEVTTSAGHVLRCTPDHRFLTERGYAEAQHLELGTTLIASTDKPMAAPGGGAVASLERVAVSDTVSSIRAIDLGESALVYDLEAVSEHNLAVASQTGPAVVVHNSEYMSIDDSACNLASLNLMKFRREDGELDVEALEHAVDVVFLAQEILVGYSSYPTPEIERNAKAYRQLGLGYANLGALLMARGLPYDSDEGRAYSAAITALMTGRAYRKSAEIAGRMGPFAGYRPNAAAMIGVIAKHRAAVGNIAASETVPADLLGAARRAWDDALDVGEVHGYRNAQATVLAPTGCLVGDSLVTTSRGLVRLRTLGDPLGSKWQNLDIEVATDQGPRRASQFYVNGYEQVVSIETGRGYRIQGTPSHRIKVVDAGGEWVWRRFSEIEAGDRVPLMLESLVGDPNAVPLPPLGELYWTADFRTRVPERMIPELAELVGYFMGDGSLHAKGLRFCVTSGDRDVLDRIVDLGEVLFGIDAHISKRQGYTEVAFNSVPLVMWWGACGFAKLPPSAEHRGKGWVSHIPDAVLHTNDPAVYSAFVRGLFEADGTTRQGYVSWSTVSESFSRDVQSLLLALGFVTTRKVDAADSNWGSHERFVLRLLNVAAADRYLDVIGFIGSRKPKAVQVGGHRQASRHDHIPVSRDRIDELAPANEPLRKTMLLGLSRRGDVSRRSATVLLERTADPELEHLLGFYYDRVSTVTVLDDQPTFDLSVPDNVTYVANGFVSHNTISFMMDCDTTGVEPDFSLVKSKKLVGGGEITIVNKTVPLGLEKLGYAPGEIDEVVAYIDERNTVVGAPYVKLDHYPVFDCAIGERAVHYSGHVKMMGAIQPFISGAISKTVNMPEQVTVEDVAQVYIDAWKLGIKAIAIYRDNCKVAQPLSGKTEKGQTALAPAGAAGLVAAPRRRRLPDDRTEVGRKFRVGEYEGYIHVGLFDDGTPGDIFVDIAKEGTTLAGLMNSFMIAVSLGLQYGVPLEVYVSKFAHMRFEPSGATNDPDIRAAKSIVDYVFRWMGKKFLTVDQQEEIGILSPEVRARLSAAYASGAPEVPGFEHPTPGQTALFNAHEDAIECSRCGGRMVRAGTCYTCRDCGTSTGCG
jgi:ribonucleoside-diphosphate reductase alpha chain